MLDQIRDLSPRARGGTPGCSSSGGDTESLRHDVRAHAERRMNGTSAMRELQGPDPPPAEVHRSHVPRGKRPKASRAACPAPPTSGHCSRCCARCEHDAGYAAGSGGGARPIDWRRRRDGPRRPRAGARSVGRGRGLAGEAVDQLRRAGRGIMQPMMDRFAREDGHHPRSRQRAAGRDVIRSAAGSSEHRADATIPGEVALSRARQILTARRRAANRAGPHRARLHRSAARSLLISA